jgi:hypothetical protein
MSDGQQLESALDLMRRMPPTHIEKYLGQIIDLVPDLAEDVLQVRRSHRSSGSGQHGTFRLYFDGAVRRLTSP